MMYPYFQEAEALIDVAESTGIGLTGNQHGCFPASEKYKRLKLQISAKQDWYKSHIDDERSFDLDFAGVTEYNDHQVVMRQDYAERSMLDNPDKRQEYLEKRQELVSLVFQLRNILLEVNSMQLNYALDLEGEHKELQDKFERCNNRLISFEKLFLILLLGGFLVIALVASL